MSVHLQRILDGTHLPAPDAATLLRALADPGTSDALAGALLVALRAKGESPDELRGFAEGMRALAVAPPLDATGAVDVVGTGGDGSGSLNLSTGAALLAAACGVRVIKHGNRSVSSRCGSADVLEALGHRIASTPEQAAADFARTGFTFLFAPVFHPAMKRLAGVRRALGVRTVFNLLGPLTNPADPPYRVIGAASPETARLMAEALAGSGVSRAFVVHGAPGWDEATPVGPFLQLDVRDGAVREEIVDPLDHGVPRCRAEALVGGEAPHNALRLRAALDGERGAHRDALALGAGLALRVSGLVARLAEGIDLARAAIDDGRATRLVEAVAAPASRKASHG